MFKIFKVEVSTNGRTHLLLSDDKVDIEVETKVDIEKKRIELKNAYEEHLQIKDLTIYLSYVEK